MDRRSLGRASLNPGHSLRADRTHCRGDHRQLLEPSNGTRSLFGAERAALEWRRVKSDLDVQIGTAGTLIGIRQISPAALRRPGRRQPDPSHGLYALEPSHPDKCDGQYPRKAPRPWHRDTHANVGLAPVTYEGHKVKLGAHVVSKRTCAFEKHLDTRRSRPPRGSGVIGGRGRPRPGDGHDRRERNVLTHGCTVSQSLPVHMCLYKTKHEGSMNSV